MSLAELADRQSKTTVLGLPLYGDPEFPSRFRIDQWDETEFSEILRPLLASDHIVAIRWTQYTPFFNDGDVCEFGIGEVTWRVDPDWNDDVDSEDWDSDYEDGFYDRYNYRISGGQDERYVPGSGVDQWGYSVRGRYEPYGDVYPQHPDYAAMGTLTGAMSHFGTLMYDNFGDHATVTIYKDRITVEYYDHD